MKALSHFISMVRPTRSAMRSRCLILSTLLWVALVTLSGCPEPAPGPAPRQQPENDQRDADLLVGAWTCVEDVNLESLKTTNTGAHPVGCRLLSGGAIQFDADGTGWDLKQYWR